MKGYKELILANFNCLFGKNETSKEPMLNYFEKIIFPAFLQKYQHKQFFFHEISIKEYDTDKFYLYGKIIRQTTLEINSIFNTETETLEDTNYTYKTSPYSEFILLLENHRLILCGNQKGSPTITNFQALMRSSINKIIKDNNKHCETGHELPSLYGFEVIELPKTEDIKKSIEKFDSISKFSLKIMSLNNDILDDAFFEDLQKIKDLSKSKSSELNLTNPENRQFIAEAIEKSAGLATFTLKAREKKGEKAINYRNNEFKEKLPIYLNEHNNESENEIYAIKQTILDPRMSVVSPENKKAYNKLISFFRSYL